MGPRPLFDNPPRTRSGRDRVRTRRRRRAALGVLTLPLAAAALIIGCDGRPGELVVAERYTAAWNARDYGAMYAELSDAARRRVTQKAFAAAHRSALATATATGVAVAGPAVRTDAGVRVPTVVHTRLFGILRGDIVLPLNGEGDAARIDWRRSLAFPGMPAGSRRLRRTLELPPRATLLTRGGGTLAAGPERAPDASLADVAAETVGGLGPIPDERASELAALGVPKHAQVGTSGLERILDTQLLGRPGGRLLAGGKVLARVPARRAARVRTTIVARVQRAAVKALAGRVGGVVALDPRSGQVLAFAGIPFSGLQPPGSTFKIITVAGALEAGIVKPAARFPIETAATLSGVTLQNAHGEACGGTLVDAFAHSCNSVFAPLGAKLGARRLVAVARRFGFDTPPDIPGAATPTIPSAAEIGDDLAVGSSAIGQGRVQATALTMATVAATIAMDGRRPRLTLAAGGNTPAPTTTVTTPRVAAAVERMMLAAVRRGTGTAAALADIDVAGKTGTAELTSTQGCGPPSPCPADDPSDTDAWFAAYAPAGAARPRVAVGVLLVRNGAGGETAAPIARDVLRAALTH